MHDLLKFHNCHGRGIVLSENASVATRSEDFCNGIVFSSKPIKHGQKACLELTQTSDWSGAIRIGVTTHDPAKVKPDSLPHYACPELTRDSGNWARALNERYAESGNRITFYVNNKGELHYFVNKEHKGVFLSHLPNDQLLWLLFDIYGNTTTAKFVQPDEAPVEILARGPDALRAFHTACESGTQPVFRTRLMLVGQDGVGKTSLKKALTGQRHDQSEVSTDGIDLSASCSFNLRDRQAWKLALRGNAQENGDQDPGPLSVMGGVESLEEEYHQALATNIVQELIYLRKQQEKEVEGLEKAKKASNCDKPSTTSARRPTRDRSASYPSRVTSASSAVSQLSQLTTASLKDHQLLQEVPDRVVQLVTELMKKREEEEEDGSTKAERSSLDAGAKDAQSGRNITLNIWDFAGQAVYYTTHQVFLSSRAVYLMVFDLSSDLDEAGQELVRTPRPGDNQLEYLVSELTNLDYMDFWMNSIHAHAAQNTRDSVDNTTLSPPIFIVGTHRDSLDPDPVQREKIVAQKFDRIRQHVAGKSYERHIFPKFHAVENNLTNGEDEQILQLRRDIEEVSSKEPYMGEQMPIKWLRFEQLVTQLVDSGTFFSSMGQIREVAKETGILLDSEFDTLLGFYHDQGVVIHYGGSGTLDTVLRNTVILQPQWLINMFKRVITSPYVDHNVQVLTDLWQRLLGRCILEERLLDVMWSDAVPQKPALLGLMEKFDLIAERLPPNQMASKLKDRLGSRSFYVPCRLQRRKDFPHLFTPTDQDVVFYFDFNGFLPDGLFHRMLTRSLRWSQDCGGHDPKLFFRRARFFIDSEHDFILEMAPIRMARLKVTVIRLVDLDESEESCSENSDKPLPPPRPSASAKVRNFIESTLSDLREMWMKRVSYKACVECTCDRDCAIHNKPRCNHADCVHFLNLDECISNKVVCCEHRRVKTSQYRKWFPAPVQPVSQGPLLPSSYIEDCLQTPDSPCRSKESDLVLPSWVRSAAKLLNGGCDGQDWMALAKRLEYKKNKLDKFSDDLNPGLSLITDWVISSGNTSLSMDILITYLEQMQRDDIVEIIQKGQEAEQEPPQVFISYQWDSQDEVNSLRDRLEKAGYSCWMDIGQMGGGDQLYTRIDEGIRNAKVVIACLSPKYVVSHLCNKEISLADLLRKSIIPVMYEKITWPPPGGMALMFSQLVFINMKGVGGHGGSGIHADIESKYQEIIQRVSAHALAKPHPRLDISIPHNPQKVERYQSQPSLRSEMYDAEQGVGEGIISYLHDGSVAERGTFNTISSGGISQTGTSARADFGAMYHRNQVEQVHVTKCAVCTIL